MQQKYRCQLTVVVLYACHEATTVRWHLHVCCILRKEEEQSCQFYLLWYFQPPPFIYDTENLFFSSRNSALEYNPHSRPPAQSCNIMGAQLPLNCSLKLQVKRENMCLPQNNPFPPSLIKRAPIKICSLCNFTPHCKFKAWWLWGISISFKYA